MNNNNINKHSLRKQHKELWR